MDEEVGGNAPTAQNNRTLLRLEGTFFEGSRQEESEPEYLIRKLLSSKPKIEAVQRSPSPLPLIQFLASSNS